MEEKIYFVPGDIVTIKQDIPYKPVMIVEGKVVTLFKKKDNDDNCLKGIRCRWFTQDGHLQEAIWNTKDLIKLN